MPMSETGFEAMTERANEILAILGNKTKYSALSVEQISSLLKEAKENVQKIVDAVHKIKIDISDEILVINKDDYIGESTKSEIIYAINNGKHVKYAYPHKKRDWEPERWSPEKEGYKCQQ